MKTRNSEGKSHKNKKASKYKKQSSNSTSNNGTNGKDIVNKSYFQLYLQRETPEQRARRLQNLKEDKKRRRALETEEQRLDRLREEAEYMKKRRYNETPEQRKKRLLQRKRHYRETRGKKTVVSPETENIKSASIVKTKLKLPSKDISKRNSKRQNVYNKENHLTVGMSTRANKRCSTLNDFLFSTESTTEKAIHFGVNSDRQSVDINEDQSAIEPRDLISSPNGSSVLKESTTENTNTSGIYSETNFGLASTILLYAACKKHHSEYYHQNNHKSALICTTPRYNYSNILDIIYWRKYTTYLNEMSLNRRPKQ